MTTIRKIVTSKIDGNGADDTSISEIRPHGETAFYLDTNTNPNKLVLMMFDGVRTHRKSKVLSPGILYGSNADSGDGNGYDTIKLIPDASLGTDQYLVIDPTQGEPGHIHIRAGGEQDSSTADLYLGAERNHVKVSDTEDNIVIKTTYSGEGQVPYNWTFNDTGKLTFPSGGAIESWGMGWIGLTNGDSNTPVSIAYKKNDGESPIGLSEIMLGGSNTAGSVNIYTQDITEESMHQWIFNSNGAIVFPDETVQTTAYNGITNVVTTIEKAAPPTNTGIPTALADSTWSVPLTDGSYGPFTGSIVGVVYNVVVSGGTPSYNIVSYPSNLALNATIDQLNASSLGGAPGNFSNIVVSAVNDSIALDLTKSINKLSNGEYTLADGVEGQIMYLVRSPDTDSLSVSVFVLNGDGDSPLKPFAVLGGEGPYPNDGICTLIFTDGTWKQTGGMWD